SGGRPERPRQAQRRVGRRLDAGDDRDGDEEAFDVVSREVVGTAEVRVIHASPDAPAVNIKLDGATAISNLDYAQSTGFASIEAGTKDVTVEGMLPTSSPEVISVPGINFAAGTQTTIMAVDTLANLEELVVSDSASTPSAAEVALNVIHAAPVAGIVDVYLTPPGVSTTSVGRNFEFDFKQSVDAGSIAAGMYRIQVTENNNDTNVLFDSGDVDLTPFAGEKLLVVAMDTVNSTTQGASDIKIVVVTDSATVEILDTTTLVGARVIHASPNADAVAAGDVEVWAAKDGAVAIELIPGFSYTDVVPNAAGGYVGVESGSYVFDVSDDNAGPGTLYTSGALALDAGVEYSVIAAGTVAGAPAFDLLPTVDNNRSVSMQASVKLVHGAPDVGTVDVYVTPAGAFTEMEVVGGMAGDPNLPNFEFGQITDYIALAPGSYDLWVVQGGAAIINATQALADGVVATVIAIQPNSTGTPTDPGFIILTN
ncbi:MAG: DUF4397 domain-containing protein, partial [Pseudomonadota bacterium]